MICRYPGADLYGCKAEDHVQHNSACKEHQVYARMPVTFKGKCKKRVIAFYQPEEDHSSHEDQDPVATGNMFPILKKVIHEQVLTEKLQKNLQTSVF